MSDILSFSDFMFYFDKFHNFAFTKINHGFWEGIAHVYAQLGRPVPSDRYAEADRVAGRPYFFEGGFVEALLELLTATLAASDPSMFFGIELSAWPDDNNIIGTPDRPACSVPIFKEYTALCKNEVDGLILKRAVMDGRILELFELLRQKHVILVGPAHIHPLIAAARFNRADFLPIHPTEARRNRDETEQELCRLLDRHKGDDVCILLQAGTLAPFWILRLRERYPAVRWIDGGLAFSIACPADLLNRPWGKVYRREILTTYAKLAGVSPVPTRNLLPGISETVDAVLSKKPPAQHIDFVENKPLDLSRIARFTEPAQAQNRWTNRGPAWEILGQAYKRFFGLPVSRSVVACANGGIALAALTQLHAAKAGRLLRWVVSAFGFFNTVRGIFADAQVVDCDAQGMLSLSELIALDRETYDGVIVTNPFGLAKDFRSYADFAKANGKILLLDNASGINPMLPDLPYQAFSLHQTKPFGFGEGGLIIVPDAERELLLCLLEYSPLSQSLAPFWVGNGKISELSCAALLARLEASPEWGPLYEMQSIRINNNAIRAGLSPLLPSQKRVIATSLPYLCPRPVPVEAIRNEHFVIGKFYKPLAPLPNVTSIYERLVNIPSHPEMKRIDTDLLQDVLRNLACGEIR